MSRRTLTGYALGSLANGAFATVPSLVLLFFLTDTLGVPAATAGLAVFLPKAFDVVWNPRVGAWSDRTRSRWGPRRPWLLAGGLLLPPLFVAIFAVPDLGTTGRAAWVCGTFLLAGAAYGFFQVPYTSLPAELADDPEQRSRLQTVWVVVLSLGILLGGALAPVVVDAAGGGRDGYLVMAVAVAVVLAVGMLGCVALLPTTGRAGAPAAAPATEPPPPADPATGPVGGGGLVAALRVGARSPRYWALYTGYLLQALAIAVALAAIPYYAEHLLGRPGFTSVLFVAFVGPAVLVVPLWRRLEHRHGKLRCLQAASWLFAGSAALAAPGWGAPVLPVIGFVGCGSAYAAQQLFAYSLLADTLAGHDAGRDEPQAGRLAGLWSASETGMFAVGPAVVGGLLGASGFVPGTGSEAVAQPAGALVGISLAMGLIPAALVVASTRRFRRYGREPRPAGGQVAAARR